MKSIFLPWTARGVRHGSSTYLAAVSLDYDFLRRSAPPVRSADMLIDPDMPFTRAIRAIAEIRSGGRLEGPPMEYGCFNHDGSLIQDPSLRFSRQVRNILYYIIRDLFNVSRRQPQHSPGMMLGVADTVPTEPRGNWGALITEVCPHKAEVERALQPLIEHRSGQLLVLPKLDPPAFVDQWLQPRFNDGSIPPYLLICETFENFPLEYQFILNSFAVAGRLWFDDPGTFETYVQKVLTVERGQRDAGTRCIVASPVDDDVTFADNENLIKPLLELPKTESLPMEPLLPPEFGEQSLLEAAGEARFLALYCHGVGLTLEEWEKKPGLQGAFLLEFGSESDEGLLTTDDFARNKFVPGGIVFSPACLAGGTMVPSDFSSWIDPEGLTPYGGGRTKLSETSLAMLGSPRGPIAVLAHFDISIASSAPMFNSMTQRNDLQTMLHTQFLRHLAAGWTLGRATKPFRWAAGTCYAQSIYIFGQMTGTYPYIGTSGVRKTIGQAVNSMNQYHVAATDMRNYIILGDPAVRLPS
ncbi:MAG: hypothetical protein HYX84_01035 [Chloroflexi bacterium]|nr:hypothetical protein [Chloroflexota bacterium]